ncbi:MAG: DsbA family protein [Pseudomonadota bacterium]|nr:DsbA family protein [Pseudomonadota bacterium]
MNIMKGPGALALGAVALVSAAIGGALFWGGEHYARADGAASSVTAAGARAYLLDHPDMIPDVIDTLRQRAAGKVIAANRAAILQPYAGAWAGNPKGDVTIVEYFDYNCGYCRASLPVIQSLLASDPGLRIVYRELPVLSPESGDAAKLSLAAARQGKFMAFHRAMYAGGQITPASMAQAVKAAGVDPGKPAPDAVDEINRNMALARDMGATGTPSWVIGDHVISSALPLDELQKLIAEVRAARH